MSFLQREIEKLNEILRTTPLEHEAYQPAYAAQQALSWAIEPDGFASPTATITKYFGVGKNGTKGTGIHLGRETITSGEPGNDKTHQIETP